MAQARERFALVVLILASCSHGAAQSTAPTPSSTVTSTVPPPPPKDASTAIADASSSCPPPPIPLFSETVLPGEDTVFAGLGTQIQFIQQTFHGSRGAPVTRGFHAKTHACLLADFEVGDNAGLVDTECAALPAGCPDNGACSSGVFGQRQKYKAWVRFSNGLGYAQGDSAPDVRGMAVKVMGVQGTKLLPGQETAVTQDFLMTNASTALTDTAQEFMGFAQATTSTTGLAAYLIKNPSVALRLTARTNAPVASMLDAQFWSGSAYELGRHAIKFTARPHVPLGKTVPSGAGDNYLRDDIVATLAAGDVVFDFFVQTQLDQISQPIERPTVEWPESVSPFVLVATLTIHQQDLTSAAIAAQEAFCGALAFNPWHALVAQRPLGNVNRGRKAVYLASSQARASSAEPTGNEF